MTLDESRLMLLEAELSAQMLGDGLTAIRKHNFAHKGYFYRGMFSYTIGLERLLKLILLSDYRRTHGKLPTTPYLRGFSHDLGSLLDQAKKIQATRQLEASTEIFQDELTGEIIALLTQFAKTTRYHNLDTLQDQAGFQDPIAHWDQTIAAKLITKHHRVGKHQNEWRMAVPPGYCPGVIVGHTTESGSPISTLREWACNHP